MTYSNIHFEGGRSYRTFRTIYNMANIRFNSLLNSARAYNITISLNRSSISDVRGIAGGIAKRRLENDKRTLDLFEKAISINNHFTMENLAGPYQYDLDLGKLLPSHLEKQSLQKGADLFLGTKDLNEALNLLRDIGALKRDYRSPLDDIVKFSISWTIDDVHKLAAAWFGELIKKSAGLNILLRFDGSPINESGELAEKIYKYNFEKDGRTLGLFKRSMGAAISIAQDGASMFSLDLFHLTPQHLKKNGVSENNIEDMVDCTEPGKIVEFLQRISALKIGS